MEDGFLLIVVLSVPRLAVSAAPYKTGAVETSSIT
jgi:hypothetical protein